MSLENSNPLSFTHPLVNEWFTAKFGSPTEPQIQGWPSILRGNSTLISAPTGSGKTFAAFLAYLNKLVCKALEGDLENTTELLYISPLKALGNDVQKNLLEPLAEISALAKERGLPMQDIKVAVRSGDTLAKDRVAMLKKPPHILITTPESFYILLTAEKSRDVLKNIKTVIIDEIHAVANDKRGTHLLLSLERLEVLTLTPITRIGLSATQKPLEKIAQFLVGSFRPLPTIINIGHIKQLDLSIETPRTDLAAVASNDLWEEIYDRLEELIQQNRSTLIFVNTRRLAERVSHHLAQRLGAQSVAAHHGSLSRKLRLQAEIKLKQGELKALVATASLELGIDIGYIDLVCQIGSPRSIGVALQRIGRAGHYRGAISKGKIFATTRDELLECAALVYAIRTGDLDQLIIPQEPLDILAQQIVAACATSDWQEDDLFKLIRQAYPYKNLARVTFNKVIEILSSGISGTRGRYSAYLFHDQINHLIKGRRNSRLTAIMNGGAIPENGLFTVLSQPEHNVVGTLDEDFAVESHRGDIILLGTTSWQIERIESRTGKMFVHDAHGALPTIPFWLGDAPARTDELSLQVSLLREHLDALLPTNESSDNHTQALDWLQNNARMSQHAARQIVDYLLQGRAILGAIPTQKTIIAERFFDESGGMQLILHAPFGARINKAWGLALRKRFCRSFNLELQASASDDGLNISLMEQHSFPLLDVFKFLHSNSVKDVLTQAVLQSPLFTTRWRWTAGRALALVRYRYGKKIPPNIQRMIAIDLLSSIFPQATACQDNLNMADISLPDHPLILETMKDALTNALDVEQLQTILTHIENSQIKCIAIDTPMPSPFAMQILNVNPYAFLDDAPLEERRARAVEMRRYLPQDLLKEIGQLNPDVIKEVQMQSWPDLRNPDELHDFLQTLIVLPITNLTMPEQVIKNTWHDFFAELNATKRAGLAIINHQPCWFATEKMQTFLILYPDAILKHVLPNVETNPPLLEEAVLQLVRGWLQHLGPVSEIELCQLLMIPHHLIHQALLGLENTGQILRGQFRLLAQEGIEWCERRLLARIHRLTLARLRKEISPIDATLFIKWLYHWQHVMPESMLQGEEGLLEILKQLQGIELPAKVWEHKILNKRIVNYNSFMLDKLTMTGLIGWGRLSLHPTFAQLLKHKNNLESKRIVPSSIIPISFFIRDENNVLFAKNTHHIQDHLKVLSHVAQQIYSYLFTHGASFFFDLQQHIKHLPAEIESGLWELIAAGLLTADSFDNLRALIDPRRRLKKRRGGLAPRKMQSRWSLLKLESGQEVEGFCWLLLKRYGIVFRDLLIKEKNIPPWRELLVAFRRLEDRGEIRGGRFVSGFNGEQFALPDALHSLRILREKLNIEQPTFLSPFDPLSSLSSEHQHHA